MRPKERTSSLAFFLLALALILSFTPPASAQLPKRPVPALGITTVSSALRPSIPPTAPSALSCRSKRLPAGKYLFRSAFISALLAFFTCRIL